MIVQSRNIKFVKDSEQPQPQQLHISELELKSDPEIKPDQAVAIESSAQVLASAKFENSTLTELSEQLKKSHKIESLIGKGGMGSVYKAKNLILNRFEAIKILPEQMTEEGLRIMQAEARALSEVLDANIASVFNVGLLQSGKPYILMEYIDGAPLAEIIDKKEPLNIDWVLYIFAQTCFALDKAHEAGIVHLDLKPDNVIITSARSGFDGVKVIDFGIAKNMASDQELTEPASHTGSPRYMSPEQFTDAEVTDKADIYALACLLHTMLTGKPPFSANSVMEIASLHLSEAPPKLAKDLAYFQPVFDRALAKDPALRYETGFSMWQDLYKRHWSIWRRPWLVIPQNRHHFLTKSRKPIMGVQLYTGVFWSLVAAILVTAAGAYLAPPIDKSIWYAFIGALATACGVTVLKARLKYPFVKRG